MNDLHMPGNSGVAALCMVFSYLSLLFSTILDNVDIGIRIFSALIGGVLTIVAIYEKYLSIKEKKANLKNLKK